MDRPPRRCPDRPDPADVRPRIRYAPGALPETPPGLPETPESLMDGILAALRKAVDADYRSHGPPVVSPAAAEESYDRPPRAHVTISLPDHDSPE